MEKDGTRVEEVDEVATRVVRGVVVVGWLGGGGGNEAVQRGYSEVFW
jgi:hypothetical protein